MNKADIILLIFGIAAATLVLYKDINDDFKEWLQERPIDHKSQAAERLLYLCPSFVLVTLTVPWWGVVAAAPMICSWYWVLFDGLLANKKGYNFWWLGSNDPDDGFFDNLLQPLTRIQHISLKLGCVLVSTIGYILIYNLTR